jgi:hypothetical protein
MTELTNGDIGDLLGSLQSIAEELGCIHVFLRRIAETLEDPVTTPPLATHMHPDLLAAKDVAAIYGCSIATVHRLVASGTLTPAIQAPGKRGARLFRRADVLAAAVATEKAGP